MTARKSCPSCGGSRLVEIDRIEGVPVQSCILLDSRAEALDFPRGTILLAFCDDCGLVFNACFDPALVDYGRATEESQHFSSTFDRFARGLVESIAEQYDLTGRRTLEIGCGKGEFLRALVARTGTVGLGIDPGFLPERAPEPDGRSLAFRREHFDPAAIEVPPDFILCRHTLEHIAEVGAFVRNVARLADGRPEVGILFETPDVARVLEEGAFWDIYYEHCSYFSLGSHARLFRREGLRVTRLRLAYAGQYIIQHAAPGTGDPLPCEDDLGRMRARAAAYPARVAETRRRWSDFVRARLASGRRVAIWGGGSKCVSFLTTTGLWPEVAQVIDINPFKQGKYLPGTGLRVSSPADAARDLADSVIVMNPVYLDEVAGTLRDRGASAELVAV